MRSFQNIGAQYLGNNQCLFHVWAPLIPEIRLHVLSPLEKYIPLSKEGEYHQALVSDIQPGTLYYFSLSGQKERPDPASRFQPQGVHGPSQVIDLSFPWEDKEWPGIVLQDYIIYEIHVGTFTREGTFEAIIPYLKKLKELGVTAIELMPVGQFPGTRNWGYDGVYFFAVQNSYGGPKGLQKFINACHQLNLAVILDVIYNHLGPEGNYLKDFAPYFTSRYQTPWGEALNFDGPYSDGVREFFYQNALYWIREFHIDALRLDALHAVYDFSAQPFLRGLADLIQKEREQQNKYIYLIAESDLNDRRLIDRKEYGGYGLDAQWNDDFHHALHALLTGERAGYYQDFGQIEHLAKSFAEGFVYTGEYSSFRQRRHGSSSRDLPAWRMVVFSQNHDQVGNRALGERSGQLLSFAQLKLAAAATLLSPFLPLLFMGEEYGERAPFLYFISHTDPHLVEKVIKGRQNEFADFYGNGEIPDPYLEETFQKCQLNHELCLQGKHKVLWHFYQYLIQLRRTLLPLKTLDKAKLQTNFWAEEKVLFLRRWAGAEENCVIFNFGSTQIELSLPIPIGEWEKKLDSDEQIWVGEGSSIPLLIYSSGSVFLKLNSQSVILYAKRGGG